MVWKETYEEKFGIIYLAEAIKTEEILKKTF